VELDNGTKHFSSGHSCSYVTEDVPLCTWVHLTPYQQSA